MTLTDESERHHVSVINHTRVNVRSHLQQDQVHQLILLQTHTHTHIYIQTDRQMAASSQNQPTEHFIKFSDRRLCQVQSHLAQKLEQISKIQLDEN